MKALDDILSWYEASLPPRERKQRGHFSTPPELVQQLFDACGYSPEADLARVRVLDPACGGGNFLLEATHRLLAFGTRVSLDQAAQTALVQRNVWGYDPDPVACFLAEMQLRAVLEEKGQVGELHIHQADALALPWEPCVDLFIANPPYLAAKNTDLSGYQSAHRRGQADSYLLFLSLALQAVRPDGWMGLVLPDPLLARANAAKERERLLKDATVHHIWHLSGVFAAEVGAVVIIAQQCAPRRLHQVSWVRGRWQREVDSMVSPVNQVPQALLRRQPGAEFRYLLGSGRGAAIERLRTYIEETPGASRRFAPLGEFLTISRGEELGKNNPYITAFLENASFTTAASLKNLGNMDLYNSENGHPYYPVLLGGVDVRPYAMPTATHWIAREAVTKPLERYLSAKLLVVKSTGRLQATLDKQGHVALQTLYLLHLRAREASEDDLYFFLALLNSCLLSEYVYMLHTAYKWVQPQIEQSVLAGLPVPLIETDEQQRIGELARQLVGACSTRNSVVEWGQDIERMYEKLERAISMLYASALPGLFVV